MIPPLPLTDSITYSEGISSHCYEHPQYYLILDHDITRRTEQIFSYDLYTQFQNRIMKRKKPVYRFYDETTFEDIERYINRGFASIKYDTIRTSNRDNSDTSALEYYFESQFLKAYGQRGISALHREYPLISHRNTTLYLDYVIRRKDGSIIAVEENGITYHHPQLIGRKRYLHQLEKQNICTKYGITLYRLSSDDIRFPDRVIDEIREFFGEPDDFEPVGMRIARPYALYEHQRLSVAHLKAQRERAGSGGTAALIVLPTASGKSEIIIEDISSFLYQHPDAKVAVVSPTVNVANKWHDAFKRHNLPVLTGTYHLIWELYRRKTTETYDYLCIDEAHHAISPMTRKALMYLNPSFLVGLTATPERLDRRKLEDVFGSYNTGLSLTEAMEKGIINTLRVLRVETNLDLREVRFNGKDYVNADLEKRIEVPTRDETIAKVLARYFHKPDVKGVIFCVSVRHAKKLAKVLGDYGLKARPVSSQDRNAISVLEEFSNREFNFLCSVNMLNEGWDEPGINVMVMARPTMSKVLYMQQLGRGLRKSGKDGETFVIDVVDQYGYLARPWSTHALFNTASYVPFGDIIKTYQVGDTIEYLGISEQILSIQEVDPFTFETKYGEYLSVEETARQLFVNTGTLNSWIRKKKVDVDLTIPFGSRTLNYFAPDSIDRIREVMGLKEHSVDTIRDDFFEFLESKTYTFSFKMVFLLSLLDACDRNGEAPIEQTLESYRSFYRDRIRRNLPVDRKSCVYTEHYLADIEKIKKSMLNNPFEKFERKRFIYYGKDVALLSFHPRLWEELTADDITVIRAMMREHLKEYYESFGGL